MAQNINWEWKSSSGMSGFREQGVSMRQVESYWEHFLSQHYATVLECRAPRRFKSDSALMPELGWCVQTQMKYFLAVLQWQQLLFPIYACKMLLHRIREDFCAIQALVTCTQKYVF